MKKYYMTHPNWKNYIHHNQSDQLQNRRHIYKLKKQLKPTTYTYTENLLLNKNPLKQTYYYETVKIISKSNIYFFQISHKRLRTQICQLQHSS